MKWKRCNLPRFSPTTTSDISNDTEFSTRTHGFPCALEGAARDNCACDKYTCLSCFLYSNKKLRCSSKTPSALVTSELRRPSVCTSKEEGNDNGPLQAIRQLTAAGGPMPNAWGSFGRNGVIIGRTDKGALYSLLLFSFLHGSTIFLNTPSHR